MPAKELTETNCHPRIYSC